MWSRAGQQQVAHWAVVLRGADEASDAAGDAKHA
jgi:hypothetical protein